MGYITSTTTTPSPPFIQSKHHQRVMKMLDQPPPPPSQFQQQMSPVLCKEGILNRFELLANQLSAGWKYHVSNTDGVKEAWTSFEDFYTTVCSFTEASIGPPRNVRVQAVSNTSVVVQWDFDDVANDGSADGFVVRYIHEPTTTSSASSAAADKWRTQTVMDPRARYLEITRLLSSKPYAFCVLAIKQSRLGPCSDPPITIQKLEPTFVVHNLHMQYKTSQSVAFHWEYSGTTTNLGFYIKQIGQKTYLDPNLEEKTLVSPGFEKKLGGGERYYLWQTLRPCMNYTFLVGLYSLDGDRVYWPKELIVQTSPTGPPFVEPPNVITSQTPTTAQVQLKPASEEYGPISHYWLIVVPANYTKEDVLNVETSQFQQCTTRLRTWKSANASSTSSSVKAATKKRQVPSPRQLDGVYITAQIPSKQLQRLYRDERSFVVGDGNEYSGYLNHPLDPSMRYGLMMRAFAKEDDWHKRSSDNPFEYRPPMQEPASRLFSDSILIDPFSTRSTIFGGGSGSGSHHHRGSSLWLMGPLVVLFVIALIMGMLVLWWLKCRRKGGSPFRRGGGALTSSSGAAIAKVAFSSDDFRDNGVLPTETSKLLLGMDSDGRPVLNNGGTNYNNGGVMNVSSTTADAYDQPATKMMGQHHALVTNHMGMQNGNGVGSGTLRLGQHLGNLSSSNNSYSTPPPIPLADFATHIDRLKLNNNALFIQEYESIETGGTFTWENSQLPVNQHKNRYQNIVAYDHSRVVLQSPDGDSHPGSDYINANYIDGYDRPRAYIATQGPLPETFTDFWRMVWQERSAVIVMLTRLEERSREKCGQYWQSSSSRSSSTYGDFKVTLLSTTELAHYSIRTIQLENKRTKEHPRVIQHAQFTAWPDHGVPTHPSPFLAYLKKVKSLNPPDAGPIITHCSAGVGRTGAFIVIDCMLERLRFESTVDIYGCVKAIRTQRSAMVQVDDQYIFIHDAVLDAAQSGSTEVPSSRLAAHVKVLSHPQPQMDDLSGMEIEYRTLITLRSTNARFSIATSPHNAPKNRSQSTIPYDANRVPLLSSLASSEGGGDYINASWIDGYRERNAYIATQSPLSHTVNDFWRMLWEQEVSLIAILNDADEAYVYWPTERRELYGQLEVGCVSEFALDHYFLREFTIKEQMTGKSRTIRQFQFVEWPGRGVPSPASFVDYVRQLQQTKLQFGSTGPICVHCLEGAGRSGVFIATAIIIERTVQEKVVDVFTTVKMLRMQRPNMVETREEYELCYSAALEFLAASSFDHDDSISPPQQQLLLP